MTIGYRPRSLSNFSSPRRRQVYEGQDKILYEGPEIGTYVLYFKDETARGEGPSIPITKSVLRPINATVIGKGAINNRLSELMMTRLSDIGIPTHFLRRLNMREQLVRATEILPFQVLVHNASCDYFAKRLGLEEGISFPQAIIEFALKSRDLRFPIVSQQHITILGWADEEEVDCILQTVQRINDFLSGQFLALGIRLMSFAVEFGRIYLSEHPQDSQVILIDEISPDTCHLLDLKTNTRLDKSCLDTDDQHSISYVYQELAERLGLLTEGGPPDLRECDVLRK